MGDDDPAIVILEASGDKVEVNSMPLAVSRGCEWLACPVAEPVESRIEVEGVKEITIVPVSPPEPVVWAAREELGTIELPARAAVLAW